MQHGAEDSSKSALNLILLQYESAAFFLDHSQVQVFKITGAHQFSQKQQRPENH